MCRHKFGGHPNKEVGNNSGGQREDKKILKNIHYLFLRLAFSLNQFLVFLPD